MADPVIAIFPAPNASGVTTTLDTSAFNGKLAATDNLLQEVADKLDDHTHAYSEITGNTHSHDMSALTNFLAPNDNLTDLGAADKRWKDIYAGNAVIQTSDRNYKDDIKMMEVGDCWSFIGSLSPATFRFKDGKRTHTGFIAQEVRDGLSRSGKDFAIFVDQNGVCGLRYDEAIAPIVGCVQDLQDSMINADRDIKDLHDLVQLFIEATEKIPRPVPVDLGALEDSFHKALTELEQKLLTVAERKVEDPPTPTNWLGWAAVGISVISILLRFV